MVRPAAEWRRASGGRSRVVSAGVALALLAGADAAVSSALAQRSDSWFGRLTLRPAPSTQTDANDAREQAEAARLYGDAQKSIERGHLHDARNRLEVLIGRFSESHLVDVARRDLKAVYEKLASQLDTPPQPKAVVIPKAPQTGTPAPPSTAADGFRPARQPGPDRPMASAPPVASPPQRMLTPPSSPTAKAIDFLRDEFRNTAGDRIFFTEGSAEFGARARVALEAQASWLVRNPGVNVIVAGHADDGGSREFNRDLSRRRAEAAKAKLVELGVDPARVEVLALGRDRPVSDCNAPACANQNRLVLTTISRVTLATSP